MGLNLENLFPGQPAQAGNGIGDAALVKLLQLGEFGLLGGDNDLARHQERELVLPAEAHHLVGA
jgi:hypothetical protein